MKLNFDANQTYQTDAVKSVTDLFEGQPLKQGDFELSLSGDELNLGVGGFGNRFALSEEELLKNLKAVQKSNELAESGSLEYIKYEDEDNEGKKIITCNFPNFTVEMETGTGKTYVYLRTIYELNKLYGFQKFVIVVPSVPIKEGVLKNLQITHDHFQSLYNKVPVKYDVYDSKKITQLKNFSLNNNIQILVINIDSFTRLDNIILQQRDNTNGQRPIDYIRATNPVVIMDEPQNMETEIRKKAIANLNPCFTLRYSATHRNLYNLIYKVDPVKAYDLGLVKQIEVDSVFAENSFNEGYIRLDKFNQGKTKISAKVTIDVNSKKGVQRKAITIDSRKNDLYELSESRDIYKDLYVNEFNVDEGYIELSDGEKVLLGESRGGLTDEIMKIQMRNTLEEHFLKTKKYKKEGIKVLSLFFIDKVANYRDYDEAGNPVKGKFAIWFEEIFEEFKQKYPGVIEFEVGKVHNGYFSQDKKGKWKDSNESRVTISDEDTYQLIMKDKERLLDEEEPLRFIFSHTALREGWDNPNVFQICTLNETQSAMKKRQEIGRGLRLCINQSGNRIFDKHINRLTVVANESYEDFAIKLQKEIEEDCGVEFTGRVKDKRDRKKVKLRKGYELDKNFLELWEKIKHKTTYRVEYDTEELIKEAAKSIKEMSTIRKPVVRSIKATLNIVREKIETYEGRFKDSEVATEINFIPDVVGYIQERTELTRKTIHAILKKSKRLNDVMKNPQMFLDNVVAKINEVLNQRMIDGIKYQGIAGEYYEMRLFEASEIETYRDNLYEIKEKEKTITDHIVIDSKSSPEKEFAEACESNPQVEFYIKLPNWFVIRTPIGTYNPDWALILKNESRLYFVAETKFTTDETLLRTSEKNKIKCGKKHFEIFDGVKFQHVSKLNELEVNS